MNAIRARAVGALMAILVITGCRGAADQISGDIAAGDALLAHRASAAYAQVLAKLSSNGRLDDDPALLERARRILPGLLNSAAKVDPTSAVWPWELHVTTDPRYSTFCVAGGKMMLSAAFVHELNLDDGEVATVLGHEMAHALARHVHPPMSFDLNADAASPAGRSSIAYAQEAEADAIGMELAHDAGWPAAGIVRFYEKLAEQSPAGDFNPSHPPASGRLAAARAFAARAAAR